MAKKLRVGVIFGGRSGEHEVSLRSARSVIEAMDSDKYVIVPIAIDKEGKWLSPADATRLLPAETTRRVHSSIKDGTGEGVAIIGDPTRRGLVTLDAEASKPQPLDVVFPVLHGTYGEDGTIQGLLEMAGVAYVGCGVLASSCGMDKVTMQVSRNAITRGSCARSSSASQGASSIVSPAA
jgi:D-alanine-D-alanine ligase